MTAPRCEAHGRFLTACYPCSDRKSEHVPLPSRDGIRNPALVPTDNNPCNPAHEHGGESFPSYRQTVAQQPDLDEAARLLLAWWEQVGRQRVTRMEAARHFGWNDRYAGDVLWHLRRQGRVEASGRGGDWGRT